MNSLAILRIYLKKQIAHHVLNVVGVVSIPFVTMVSGIMKKANVNTLQMIICAVNMKKLTHSRKLKDSKLDYLEVGAV